MRMVNEYYRTVRETANAGAVAGAGAGVGTGIPVIQFDSDGFPIVPATSWNKISKEDLEKIYRTYLTTHYRQFFFSISLLLVILIII